MFIARRSYKTHCSVGAKPRSCFAPWSLKQLRVHGGYKHFAPSGAKHRLAFSQALARALITLLAELLMV